MSKTVECERCHGSGEVGVKLTNGRLRETPGPIPDDVRGVVAMKCRDCNGKGELNVDEPGEG